MKCQGIGVVGRGEGFFRRWRAATFSDTQQPNKNGLFFWKFLFFLPSMAVLDLLPTIRFDFESQIHNKVILHRFL